MKPGDQDRTLECTIFTVLFRSDSGRDADRRAPPSPWGGRDDRGAEVIWFCWM